MRAYYIVLVACPVLLLGAVAFIAVIAVGIRKGDRRDLASPAISRTDAITRRVTGVSTRSNGKGDS